MKYLITYFRNFKKLVGAKIYPLLFLMMMVGFVEGIGITLFLPIFQQGFGDDKISKILEFVFSIFGIRYSFTLMLALIFIFFVIRAVFMVLYARYFGRISYNLIVTLIRNLLENVFRADYLFIMQKELGYINNIITREIPRVVDAFNTFSSLLNYAVFGLVYITLSMLLNFKLTLIMLIVSPIFIIITRKLNLTTNQISRELSSSNGKFHALLIQGLSKIKYLKATLTFTEMSEIIDKENRRLGSLGFRMHFLQAVTRDAFEPMLVFVVIGLLFYHVVILGKNVNEIIFLALLFLQIARQFLNAQSSYRKFLSSIGSIETYNGFAQELENNREKLNEGMPAPDFGKDIIFENVSLTFSNGKKVLDNVNIRIKPKSLIAFVGHSGSGKSTIANMITALLKPTEGAIFFGDINYDDINLKVLRENTGYVTQEDVIFNDSVKNNITLWKEGVPIDRLTKAIEIAHLTDFINGLPGGEATLLGDNGLNISGGQRQRITIARELYKNTQLLILDEATSALDSKYEKAVYDNLKEFKGQKTMIVIAHRLSTIKNADYIYVIDEGKIIEEGTFEELSVNKETKFYQICQLQSISN